MVSRSIIRPIIMYSGLVVCLCLTMRFFFLFFFFIFSFFFFYFAYYCLGCGGRREGNLRWLGFVILDPLYILLIRMCYIIKE